MHHVASRTFGHSSARLKLLDQPRADPRLRAEAARCRELAVDFDNLDPVQLSIAPVKFAESRVRRRRQIICSLSGSFPVLSNPSLT